MMRGVPPTELTSTTAIPGTMASAVPTERNGSARIKDPGTAVTATVDARMLVAERSGVTTTVSSCVTRAVSRCAPATCADATEVQIENRAMMPTYRVFGIVCIG